ATLASAGTYLVYYGCMSDTMIRTNVYLRPRQKARLSAAARRSGTSEAELIRLAVDRVLDDPPPARRKPQTGFITAPPFVHKIDELLAEGFGMHGGSPT
ncbi:MAG: hypothetical protein DLM55_00755, partial [Acidimicrobiales bacterium]